MYGTLIGLTVVLLAILGVLASVTLIENRQAAQLAKIEPHAHSGENASRTAVVYFSRSGNTALAARHIAHRLDAQLFRLDAPNYAPGLPGLAYALKDATLLKERQDALPEITPAKIDLTPFDILWLGSPIWLYSPAPPIWAFIENSDFSGKRVILFNTHNSHFSDEHIARFKAQVLARGAVTFEHRTVLRGRMTQQITPEQILQFIDDRWLGTPLAK